MSVELVVRMFCFVEAGEQSGNSLHGANLTRSAAAVSRTSFWSQRLAAQGIVLVPWLSFVRHAVAQTVVNASGARNSRPRTRLIAVARRLTCGAEVGNSQER